ncbi:MAG: hypothetical protein LQ341_001168 [Variospora aurantia]|nr:MAG: hypothetical protein LQ341_001168 [Variospora aurantia]
MERPSRLKPAVVDPLDKVGFVSKGDKSLLDHTAQEGYFDAIKTQYHTLTGPPVTNNDGCENTLASALESLSLHQYAPGDRSGFKTNGPFLAVSTAATAPGLSTLLLAMRKLREAIVASARNDAFAKNVYIFIIRTTILLRHPESYHPAILHLFRRLQLASPLNDVEKKEFLGYWLLDLACRQQNLASAFRVRNFYRYRTEKVDMILSALIHGNWVIFGLAKRSADVYETSLMQCADDRMANHTMQCMGKSYLSLPKEYVERCTGLRWGELKEQKKLSWTLDGGTIVIRQMKKR